MFYIIWQPSCITSRKFHPIWGRPSISYRGLVVLGYLGGNFRPSNFGRNFFNMQFLSCISIFNCSINISVPRTQLYLEDIGGSWLEFHRIGPILISHLTSWQHNMLILGFMPIFNSLVSLEVHQEPCCTWRTVPDCSWLELWVIWSFFCWIILGHPHEVSRKFYEDFNWFGWDIAVAFCFKECIAMLCVWPPTYYFHSKFCVAHG